MKMKSHLASLLVLFATSSPLLSATEVERLRALCAEQELQIAQLEQKISRLTDTPPPAKKSSAASNPAPAASAGDQIYVVKSGDNIVRIAREHGTTANALARLNGIETSSLIFPGQKLKVSGSTAATASSAAAPVRTHTVVSGDTYYKISRKYGVSVDQLVAANPGVNHKALRLGQQVKISGGSPAPSAVAKNKPAPSLAAGGSIPISNTPTPTPQRKMPEGPVRIDKQITYGQFAKDHGTTPARLDQLNGLELDPSTVLAQGSELYIPAQP